MAKKPPTLSVPNGGNVNMTLNDQLKITITDDCSWTDNNASSGIFPHGLIRQGPHKKHYQDGTFGPPVKTGQVTCNSTRNARSKKGCVIVSGHTITVTATVDE